MPWNVAKTDQCPKDKPWGVLNSQTGDARGRCHASQGDANKQMAVLYSLQKQGKIKDAATDDLPSIGEADWRAAMDAVMATTPEEIAELEEAALASLD